MTALSADRALCRALLPRVSRTFAINIRLLNGRFREAVEAGYLLCRAADTLEDSWPGSEREVAERFTWFEAALAGEAGAAHQLAARAAPRAGAGAEFELLAALPRVLGAFAALSPRDQAIVREGVGTLAAGMRRYAIRAATRPAGGPYLDTEAELHDYCWVVAGCVGVMLTRLFGARVGDSGGGLEARRLERAPAVGEALQLTNILLDWPSDIRRGRCFVPAAWMTEWGLEPRHLVERGRTGVPELAARLEGLARQALARVPDYLELIGVRHVRYRLFCLWPTLWAQASLRYARRDPEFPWGARRPRLPRSQLWGAALRSVLVAPHEGATRRLYARLG